MSASQILVQVPIYAQQQCVGQTVVWNLQSGIQLGIDVEWLAFHLVVPDILEW